MFFLLLYYFTVLILGLILLWFSGDLSVKYSVQTAAKFRLTTLFVGFVLIAVSTGFPELAVVISSVFENIPEVAAGTILGSNICDISLVLGITVLFGGSLTIVKKEFTDSIFILLIAIFAMVFAFAMQSLGRITGLFLVLIYFGAIYFLYKVSTKKEILEEKKEQRLLVKDKDKFFESKVGMLIKLFASIVILLISSDVVVRFALKISKALNFSIVTVGATILAIGTSLPELTLSLIAIKKKEYALVLGNSLGSVLEQGTLLLGILAIFSKEPINVKSLYSLIPFMFMSFFIIAFAMIKRKKIIRADAIALLITYFLFLVYEFFWVLIAQR